MDLKDHAINIKELSFTYHHEGQTVLSDLNLVVARGSRFGIFGPNGAGKTTLMGCMTGLLRYKKGNVQLFGHEVKDHSSTIKNLIGFVPQDFAFYHELTAVENLDFFGALYGLDRSTIKKRSGELFKVLHLEADKNKQLRHLSGGMKRRVNLAIGVLHEPEILFLDEPTVGVDVATRRDILAFLKSLSERGTTLIYTSHQLNEAEELCETVALINGGRIIAHDLLPQLLSKNNAHALEDLFVRLTEEGHAPS